MNKRNIENLLDEIQIPINQKGYKLWINLVELYLKDDSKNMEYYYCTLAKNYNSTRNKVERNLRHAYENNRESIQKKFKINYKVTNSALINLIAREMKREYE